MKKIEGSWCVYFDEYPGRDSPVTKYLNHYYKENARWHSNGTGKYWGVTFVKGGILDICICSSSPFGKILTEQEFLKLTQVMTKEEIENYKDFKKGDILTISSRFCTVIETLGDVVFISSVVTNLNESFNGNVYSYAKKGVYELGWRLYAPEEKSPIVELTLEDIAKKFDVDVANLKIKK